MVFHFLSIATTSLLLNWTASAFFGTRVTQVLGDKSASVRGRIQPRTYTLRASTRHFISRKLSAKEVAREVGIYTRGEKWGRKMEKDGRKKRLTRGKEKE